MLSPFFNHLQEIVWHDDIIITMPTHNKYIILLYKSIKHYSERQRCCYYIIVITFLSYHVCTQLYIPLVFRYRPYSVYIQWPSAGGCVWSVVCKEIYCAMSQLNTYDYSCSMYTRTRFLIWNNKNTKKSFDWNRYRFQWKKNNNNN